MRIFDTNENGWDEKTNFVDAQNVMVGFDRGQSCCEHHDWFIAKEPTFKTLDRSETPFENTILFHGFMFDTSFCKLIEAGDERLIDPDGCGYSILDEGSMVIFRLTNGEEELFLHLFNSHNGYYGHGFEFKGKEIVFEAGCL